MIFSKLFLLINRSFCADLHNAAVYCEKVNDDVNFYAFALGFIRFRIMYTTCSAKLWNARLIL